MTPESSATSPWRPRLELLLTAALFSTGGAAIKAISLGSWQVASLRSGIAAVTVWVLLPGSRRPRLRVVPVAAAYATTLVLFVLANKLTTAASTIFLQSTAPLYILLLAPLLLKEPVRRLDLVYMAVLAAGMSLFFVGLDSPSATAPQPLLGNVLATAAGVTWALTVVGLRFLGRDGGGGGHDAPAAVMLGNLMAAAAALLPAWPLAPPSLGDGALLLYLGVFQIGVAYVLLTRAIRSVGALEASLLLLVEPILSPLWAWLAHGEAPGAAALAGGAVILLATAGKTWLEERLGPAAPGTR